MKVSTRFVLLPKIIDLVASEEAYDVVIIGGGVSGLTSAALLSKASLSVCVVEMDARPGGYLAGFRRKDFRFDSAVHWLNQCGPKGFVYRTFSAIGSDFPKTKEQYEIKRLKSEELNLMLTNRPDELKNELLQLFPHEKKGIEKFFKVAKKMAHTFSSYTSIFRAVETRSPFEKITFGLRMMRFGMSFIPYVFYGGPEGTEKGLKKFFSDPKLLRFWVAEPDLLSCLIPIAWAYNKDYQFPPEGGGQVFPEWLVHATEQFGGKVFYQTKAIRINDDGENATSITVVHKKVERNLLCRYVVAACDVEFLYEQLLQPKWKNPAFLEKLKKAELYSSAVTLSIGLDCPTENLGFGKELLLLAMTDDNRASHSSGDPYTSDLSILAPSVRDKSLAPEGKGTLTIYAPAYIHQFDEWGCEQDETGVYVRGEKYRETKQHYADILIERVEKMLNIELKSHILYMDIATPVTHQRYTGNKNGTMMGARPGKNNYKAKIAHYKTPVKNVYLSGHWATLGGGVPIAVSTAANSSLLLLKKEKPAAFKEYARFFDGRTTLEELNKSAALITYKANWIQQPTPASRKSVSLAAEEINED